MVDESHGNDDDYGSKNQQRATQKLVKKGFVRGVDTAD